MFDNYVTEIELDSKPIQVSSFMGNFSPAPLLIYSSRFGILLDRRSTSDCARCHIPKPMSFLSPSPSTPRTRWTTFLRR